MASGNGKWVVGVSNTSNLKCKICGEWIKHWKKLAGCNEVNCCHPAHEKSGKKIADIGTHGLDISSKKHFIIPVCKEHEISNKEAIYISDEMLVDASPCNPRTIGARQLRTEKEKVRIRSGRTR
jgi:hypothetical protein